MQVPSDKARICTLFNLLGYNYSQVAVEVVVPGHSNNARFRYLRGTGTGTDKVFAMLYARGTSTILRNLITSAISYQLLRWIRL